MDWDGVGTFALFLSMGGVSLGLMVLAGFRMKLKQRLEMQRLEGGSQDEIEQLREELHDALEQQHAQITDLQERLDFTERLLTKGKE